MLSNLLLDSGKKKSPTVCLSLLSKIYIISKCCKIVQYATVRLKQWGGVALTLNCLEHFGGSFPFSSLYDL